MVQDKQGLPGVEGTDKQPSRCRYVPKIRKPLLRRGRGDEFLEARIIPERIEHRIEPEQRRGERHVKPAHP